MQVLNVQQLNFPKIEDERGNLSFIEGGRHLPFDIARVYWIYDVPGGQIRGSHAFKEQVECIIALSGSFDVVLDNGEKQYRYCMNRAYQGLFVPSMHWRTIENFSTNSVCLVLSSTAYDRNDYIEDYDLFVQKKKQSLVSSRLLGSCNHMNTPSTTLSNQDDNVYACTLFSLPKVWNKLQGNLTALNNNVELPFAIKRIYYIYDIPSGTNRGGHAHKDLLQYLVAVSGSFDVVLDDGRNRKTVHLNNPYTALMVVPGVWSELVNFSSGAVCLVLASDIYCEEDYIRDYAQFINYKHV